jgi:hypothetical protein
MNVCEKYNIKRDHLFGVLKVNIKLQKNYLSRPRLPPPSDK